jgi:hypothetical protein
MRPAGRSGRGVVDRRTWAFKRTAVGPKSPGMRGSWMTAVTAVCAVSFAATTVAAADDDGHARPTASPTVAVNVASTAATLQATSRGGSLYGFQLGTSASYGTLVAGRRTTVSGYVATVEGSAVHLTPATTYHVRFVAANDDGVTFGPDSTFTTAPAPEAPAAPVPTDPALGSPPVTPPLGDPAPAPAPQLGHTITLGTVVGDVRIEDDHGRSTAVRGTTAVPTGTIVDARRGTVELTAAIGGGRLQTGRFWGGRFEVRQPLGRHGLTQIVLRGGNFAGCPPRGRRATAAARKREPVRRLWGNDDHGRFETRGGGSVATVRGTRWYTRDTCAGTLTRVVEGTVSVRELRTGRRFVVHAGHEHLARR